MFPPERRSESRLGVHHRRVLAKSLRRSFLQISDYSGRNVHANAAQSISKSDRRFCKKPIYGYRLAEPIKEVRVDGLGVVTMSISFEAASAKYLTAKKLSGGTRKEYKSTITKWITWGEGVDVDPIGPGAARVAVPGPGTDGGAATAEEVPRRLALVARLDAGRHDRHLFPLGTSLIDDLNSPDNAGHPRKCHVHGRNRH